MSTLAERLREIALWRLPKPTPHLAPGLRHFTRGANGRLTRFHLRVEPDGRGLLLIDASAVVRLSETGTILALALLEGTPHPQIVDDALARFRGGRRDRVERDVARLAEIIDGLAAKRGDHPVLNLEDATFRPGEARLLAPFSADVDVLPSDRMRAILERLWDAGIPHVVLGLGADAPPDDAIAAVTRAEDLGLVAGVRTRASDLVGNELLAALAGAGVDHVDLAWASAAPDAHDALFGDGDHALAASTWGELVRLEVAAVADVPLVESTVPLLPATLADLAARGVRNVSAFAIATPDDAGDRGGSLAARAMAQVATIAEEEATRHGIVLQWNPTVRRDPSVSLASQARRGPRTSGDVSIRVLPDGAVVPARGPRRSAGNLLIDSWAKIWAHDVFRLYRDRVESPTRCDVCPGLALCAADCPMKPEGWAE